MNKFWYDVFVELPIEFEDSDGRMHPKGRRYTDCKTYDEIVKRIRRDGAALEQAFIVFYDKPKDEAVDITWKIKSMLQEETKKRST